MRLFRNNKILIAILTIATILRLWGLANNPPHLTSDEAALGYNAYSILKTGRDEHGELFPVIFKSFGDWKPGLYVYLTVPGVALLGLTELSVRLPGALSGIAAIYLLYLIVYRLFKNKTLALFSSFFLAISPWHIHFSRGAWEAGLSLTLTLAGIYFFLLAIKGKAKMFILSTFFFALTLWAYQGAKLASLIIILGLMLFFWKDLWKVKRDILVSGIFIGFLVSLPVIVSLLQGKTGRLEVYSLFSYRRPPEVVDEILFQENTVKGSIPYLLYHSEPLNFARGIIGHWVNYFSGRFLFFEGDWSNNRHGVPNAGVILLLDGVFLIAGFIALAKYGAGKRSLFLWFWLVFAPLPAVLSRDSIHAVRSLNLVIPLTILLAFGATFLWEKVNKFKYFHLCVFLFLCFYVLNFMYYLDQYWIHAPMQNARSWQYGYKQLVKMITPNQGKYEEIIIQQSYAQPYIYFLFYQKYDPAKYQQVTAGRSSSNEYDDVTLVASLDNIQFREAVPGNLHKENTLIVYDITRPPFPDLSNRLAEGKYKEIKLPDNNVMFEILEF